ncbi:MAG: outer membrane protein transport protein [Campylobacterales bacterium]|nr:outer membrane protein transport protein [Campylobacterales bacterium]
MKIIVISAVAAATLMAGGYAIPESSINATALSAAYIANAHGADAAYYNPAAMVYNEDANLLEVDATYIGLSAIDFSGTTGNYSSKKENFLVPSFHYTSKKLGDNGARVGFSIVAPAGLSKRWDATVPKATAEEFTLQTIEFNPSMAIPLSDTVSMGVGFRVISTSGIVKAKGTVPFNYSQNLTGDSIDYGYNLALNYRPVSNISLAATYRSKIDLNVEGSADLVSPVVNGNHTVSVTVPLPATFNLAAAYSFGSGTTVEAIYERTFWSAYKQLNFEYTNPTADAVFGTIKPKNWKDTNTYRLGLTQKYDKWTAMAGVAYDESPTPESTLGYELPDSDAWIASVGGRYQIDKSWNIGLAGLVDMKESRDVYQAGATGIKGEFSNARAYLVTAGIEYHF